MENLELCEMYVRYAHHRPLNVMQASCGETKLRSSHNYIHTAIEVRNLWLSEVYRGARIKAFAHPLYFHCVSLAVCFSFVIHVIRWLMFQFSQCKRRSFERPVKRIQRIRIALFVAARMMEWEQKLQLSHRLHHNGGEECEQPMSFNQMHS